MLWLKFDHHYQKWNVAQDSNLFNQDLFIAGKCGQEDFDNNWVSTLEAPISPGEDSHMKKLGCLSSCLGV